MRTGEDESELNFALLGQNELAQGDEHSKQVGGTNNHVILLAVPNLLLGRSLTALLH